MRPIVKDHTNLERDLTCNAILNKDRGAYKRHKNQKKIIRMKEAKITDLELRLHKLEQAILNK